MLILATWTPDKPDAIYGALTGAIIAGIIAITTTLLANRHARSRLEMEQSHDADKNAKERSHKLKCETYFPLIEELSSAMPFIVRVPTMSSADFLSSEPMMRLGRCCSRLGLVAPAAVQEPIQKIQAALTMALMSIGRERSAIERMDAQISGLTSRIADLESLASELQKRIDAHIDNATGKRELVAMLNDQRSIVLEEIPRVLAQRSKLQDEKGGLQIDLTTIALRELKPMASLIADAVIAIRSDLGVPTDEHWQKEFYRKSAERGMQAIESFQAELKGGLAGSS